MITKYLPDETSWNQLKKVIRKDHPEAFLDFDGEPEDFPSYFVYEINEFDELEFVVFQADETSTCRN